jgi:hypothetical protein
MKLALAVPHTPWVPARADSFARLCTELALGVDPNGNAISVGDLPTDPVVVRFFTERAANTVWAEKLWTWAAETDADWLVQIQDDVFVAPCFWPALRAMLSALPPEAEVIGLSSVHPMAPEIARRGMRWYRTPGNLVGWLYAVRRKTLKTFLADRVKLGATFCAQNEDEQLGLWAHRTGRMVWHPCPAIADHDVTIPSSYKNDSHTLRRPQVTWRTFDEREMTDPTWWKPSGVPDLLNYAPARACWWCMERPIKFTSASTGAGICGHCIHACMSAVLGVGAQSPGLAP